MHRNPTDPKTEIIKVKFTELGFTANWSVKTMLDGEIWSFDDISKGGMIGEEEVGELCKRVDGEGEAVGSKSVGEEVNTEVVNVMFGWLNAEVKLGEVVTFEIRVLNVIFWGANVEVGVIDVVLGGKDVNLETFIVSSWLEFGVG